MRTPLKYYRKYYEFIKSVATVGTGNVIARILGFLFFIIVARIYLEDEFGYIMYVIALATIASTAAAMGFPIALARFLSKYSTNQKLKNLYFSNALIGTILILLASIFVLFIINLLDIAVAMVVIGLTFYQFYFGVVRGFLQHKRLMIYQIGTTLTRIIAVICIFYVLQLYIQPVYVLAIFGFAFVFPLFIFEFIKPTKIKFSFNLITKKTLKKISYFSAPVIMSSLLYFVVMNIDIILVEHHLTLQDVGYYSVAKKLTFIFTFVPFGIITVLMPKVASLKMAEVRKYLKISLILTIIASTLIFIMLFGFGELAINIIFGQRYSPAMSALLILAMGMFLQSLSSMFDSIWLGIGKPEITTKIYLVGTTIAIVGCVFLIPVLNIFGAGLAFACGSVAILSGSVLYGMKYLG